MLQISADNKKITNKAQVLLSVRSIKSVIKFKKYIDEKSFILKPGESYDYLDSQQIIIWMPYGERSAKALSHAHFVSDETIVKQISNQDLHLCLTETSSHGNNQFIVACGTKPIYIEIGEYQFVTNKHKMVYRDHNGITLGDDINEYISDLEKTILTNKPIKFSTEIYRAGYIPFASPTDREPVVGTVKDKCYLRKIQPPTKLITFTYYNFRYNKPTVIDDQTGMVHELNRDQFAGIIKLMNNGKVTLESSYFYQSGYAKYRVDWNNPNPSRCGNIYQI